MTTTKSSERPTKHQLKTEATLRGLLDAAETIFVRDGYERSQIETIAAEAHRTKGAVYAHFQSKEDIFFALLERRIRSRREVLLHAIHDLPFHQQIEVIKQRFLNGIEDKNWHILMLEFKLFALRNKSSLHRMQELYQLLHDPVVEAFLSRAESFADSQKERMVIAFAVMRGIPSALILERQFSRVLNSPEARQVLEETFDSLLNLRNLKAGRKSK